MNGICMKRPLFLFISLFCITHFQINCSSLIRKKNKTIFYAEKDNISLMITDYGSNKFSTVVYTDRPWITHQFIKSGVRPVRIIINNATEEVVSVSAKSIDLACINNEQVSTNLRGNPIFETLGLSVLGSTVSFYSWIIESIFRHGRPINLFKLRNITRLPITSIINAVTLVGITYYFYTANMRDNKIEDICAKVALENKIFIKPGQLLNKILFIDINWWQPIFNFKIYNQDGSDIMHLFNVKLI